MSLNCLLKTQSQKDLIMSQKNFQTCPRIETIKKAALSSPFFKRTLLFEEVNSTNDYAKSIAGVAGGAIILAKRQTHGRGRRGNTWVSDFSGALTFSLLIDLSSTNLSEHTISVAALITAVSLHKTFNSYAEICNSNDAMQIKWPNDLVCLGKKLCGILVESTYSGKNPQSLILGIGINLSGNCDLAGANASSIEKIYGINLDVDEFFERVIKDISSAFSSGTFDSDYFNSQSYLKGKTIEYIAEEGSGANSKQRALVKGVDEQGRLILQDQSGKVSHIISAFNLRITQS